MSEEERAFAEAVLADPDAFDAPLVYGDWLLTVGDPRGELIAVQRALAADPASFALRRREQALLTAHGRAWTGPLLDVLGTCTWKLGFVREVLLDLRDARPEERDAAAALAEIDGRTLRRLEVVSSDLPPAAVAAIVAHLPGWPHLESLVLWFGNRSEARAADLAPLLARTPSKLRHLGLCWTDFTRELAAALETTALPKQLTSLDLSYGTLGAARAEELRSTLTARLELGVQYDPDLLPEQRARFDDALAAVARESAAHDAFDSEFRSNPHAPWQVARERLADVALAPMLAASLEGPHGTWVEVALEALGSSAGPAASDALAGRDAGVALFHVDERRARRRGVERRRPTRSAIASLQMSRGPDAFARHVAGLLLADDHDVLLFALDAGGYSDNSELERFAAQHPAHVPVDAVIDLLGHADVRIRCAAANVLAAHQSPEGAGPVVEAIAAGRASVRRLYGMWLGSHPASARIIARTADLGQVFEIVRRRRCAGLTTDLSCIRDRLVAALAAGPSKNDRERWLAIGDAARIVEELGATELAPELAAAIGPVEGARRSEGEGRFDELLPALHRLGDAGAKAIKAGLTTARGERRERLGMMRDELAKLRSAPDRFTRERADELFRTGQLEDVQNPDNGAYGSYARLLLSEPRSAHAALQCAWIERGFGAWISPERVEWLRSLGAPEARLRVLAERPVSTLRGYWLSLNRRTAPDPILAARAAGAGLPCVAEHYLPAGSDERRAAERETSALLA